MAGRIEAGWIKRPSWVVPGVITLAILGNYLLLGSRTTLWDRDEPRFARAAVEMLETGDYLTITFNGENWSDKPVLTYWLMALAIRELGPTELACRLFGIPGNRPDLSRNVLHRLQAPGSHGWVVGHADPGLDASDAGHRCGRHVGCRSPAVHRGGDGDLCQHATDEGPSGTRDRPGFGDRPGDAGQRPDGADARTDRRDNLPARPRSAKGRPLPLREQASVMGTLIFCTWAVPASGAMEGQFLRVFVGRHVIGRALPVRWSTAGGSFVLYLPYSVPVVIAGFFPWTLHLPGRVDRVGARQNRRGIQPAMVPGLDPFLPLS